MSYFSRRVEMAKWVLEINPQVISKLIHFAAYYGVLDLTTYFLEEGNPTFVGILIYPPSFFVLLPFVSLICSTASLNGHFDILQWLRSLDPPCSWDIYTIFANAAGSGHLNVLQWLCSHDPPCPCD